MLVGFRWVPSARWALTAAVGVGAQYEDYSPTTVASRTVSLEDTTSVTARGSARLRAQWNAFPQAVSFRASADGDILSITRDDLAVSVTAAASRPPREPSVRRRRSSSHDSSSTWTRFESSTSFSLRLKWARTSSRLMG